MLRLNIVVGALSIHLGLRVEGRTRLHQNLTDNVCTMESEFDVGLVM